MMVRYRGKQNDAASRHDGRLVRVASAALGLAVVLIGGSALGVGKQQRTPIASAGPRPAQKATHELTCKGGEDSPVRVELFPDAVVNQKGKQRIEYHAEIDVKARKGVAAAWRAEVRNDRDQVVQSDLAKGSGKGKRTDVLQSATIAADLPDGYYELRFTAAVAGDDSASTFATASQFLQVSGGAWREIDEAEWRRDSRITWSHDEAVTP